MGTFLANAMKLADEKAVDPDDAVIMQSCLTANGMRLIGGLEARLSRGLWKTTITA